MGRVARKVEAAAAAADEDADEDPHCLSSYDTWWRSLTDYQYIEATRSAYMCSNCGVSTANLVKCQGCKRARYCGRECQKANWGRHKNECLRKVAYFQTEHVDYMSKYSGAVPRDRPPVSTHCVACVGPLEECEFATSPRKGRRKVFMELSTLRKACPFFGSSDDESDDE